MSDRLNVLIATPLGSGGHGGIDRVMDNLVASMTQSDGPILLTSLPTRGPGKPLSALPVMVRFITRFVMLRRSKKLDLVHINVSQRGSIVRKTLLSSICDLCCVPYVIHIHGSQFHDSWNDGGLAMRVITRRLVQRAKRIIVLGVYWRDFLESIGADPRRLVIVPNATAHPARHNIHVNDRPVRILFLGRMGVRKGVPQLVEALSQLKSVGNWEATLAGDGEIDETRARLTSRALNEQVKVLGWAGPDDVARLQAEHDVLVLPSFNENLPMSVIEGMAHGMAVVATPVGAVVDIIAHEQTGLLVPTGDVKALAAALRRCIMDTTLRMAIGSKAREFHRLHLDLSDYSGRIEDVWRAAVADRIS